MHGIWTYHAYSQKTQLIPTLTIAMVSAGKKKLFVSPLTLGYYN